MGDIHHKYVTHFIQSGTEKFASFGFLIVPEIVGKIEEEESHYMWWEWKRV